MDEDAPQDRDAEETPDGDPPSETASSDDDRLDEESTAGATESDEKPDETADERFDASEEGAEGNEGAVSNEAGTDENGNSLPADERGSPAVDDDGETADEEPPLPADEDESLPGDRFDADPALESPDDSSVSFETGADDERADDERTDDPDGHSDEEPASGLEPGSLERSEAETNAALETTTPAAKPTDDDSAEEKRSGDGFDRTGDGRADSIDAGGERPPTGSSTGESSLERDRDEGGERESGENIGSSSGVDEGHSVGVDDSGGDGGDEGIGSEDGGDGGIESGDVASSSSDREQDPASERSMPGVPDPATTSDGRRIPEDVQKYARFQKMDGAQYERVNEFLRDRTYVTAREWVLARLCADFRTETGVEMTKIGENLPELVPFMTDTYTPQAVNQARSSFEGKVRKAGATFLYGAMCDFFTAEELDDVMYEVTEVAKFLLEVEGVDLSVEAELEAEERISSVMREVREASRELREQEIE